MVKVLRNMFMHIAPERLIGDIQREFNTVFPFLKLEFYRPGESAFLPAKRFLPPKYAIQNVDPTDHEGYAVVNESMTVAELEHQFLNLFGVGVQVYRKSGNLWLETTMTDNWTLQKQNEHGREISIK
ncbi:MAG TPA: hypothetical protein VF476_06510 [Chitinophagaceae bacterium]